MRANNRLISFPQHGKRSLWIAGVNQTQRDALAASLDLTHCWTDFVRFNRVDCTVRHVGKFRNAPLWHTHLVADLR